MRTRLPIIVLSACGYQPPIDTGMEEAGNSITGTVVVSGVDCPSQTVVLAYDASHPPPPAGLGSPIGFSTVADTAWSDAQGISSASYSITGLDDGSWLLSGLMDIDGDFNPFSSVLAGATCGDIGGLHVRDLDTLEAAPVTISGGIRASDITIILGSEYPIERPAFVFDPEASLVSRAAGEEATALQTFRLQSSAIHTAFSDDLLLDLEGPCASIESGDWDLCDPASLVPCETAFWVVAQDSDGDGQIDAHPDYSSELGLLDIWPRVYLSYLGEPLPDGGFESGLQQGESYTAEAFPLLAEAMTAQAMGDPDWYPGTLGGTLPLSELSVTWLPIVQYTEADGSTTIINLGSEDTTVDDLPAGHWAVTVIAHSGQTWTLPNDIGRLNLPATSPHFEPSTQREALVIE